MNVENSAICRKVWQTVHMQSPAAARALSKHLITTKKPSKRNTENELPRKVVIHEILNTPNYGKTSH